MKDITEKFHKDPQTIESLKKFFKSNLRDDLPPIQELYIREIVDLVLAIAANEFECSKCSSKYKIFGAEFRKDMTMKRWI